MPQIDKITYFNQLFWLFLSFSFYYCVLLKVFLPKISSVLKARKKKLAMGSSGSHSFVTEKTLFTEVRGLAVENCLSSNAFCCPGKNLENGITENRCYLPFEGTLT